MSLAPVLHGSQAEVLERCGLSRFDINMKPVGCVTTSFTSNIQEHIYACISKFIGLECDQVNLLVRMSAPQIQRDNYAVYVNLRGDLVKAVNAL